MEKCTESPSNLNPETSFLGENNLILQPQVQHPTDDKPPLTGQVEPALNTPVMSGPFSDDARVKHFFEYLSQQMQNCDAISESTHSNLLKQYENLVLELQQSYGEPMIQEMTPMNVTVDESDISPQDATTFQVHAPNLSYRETNQRDQFQKEQTDPTHDEEITDIMNNLPDLITQCIQLDKKHKDWSEHLQSERHVPVLASTNNYQSFLSPIHPLPKNGPKQLQVAHLPVTPAKRTHQQETQLCLYCNQAGHFTRDCPAKRSRTPARKKM